MKSYKIKTYILVTFIFLILNIFLFYYTFTQYNSNYNIAINNIIGTLKESYPNISEEEIVSILNTKNNYNKNNLKKYGIDLNHESAFQSNNHLLKVYLILSIILLTSLAVTLFIISLISINNQKSKIKEIENDIRKINNGNYELDLKTYKENSFSLLKSEIYKIMISLKEATINTKKDKLKLKASLEDISHQLKTPLTSIMLSVDNLSYDNISKEDYNHFLEIIKHNTKNMDFLIKSLLKLSEFDTNTVVFKNKENNLIKLIESSIKDTENLLDLKNIKLITNYQDKITIICDKYWQKEAYTNILKNAIEHAKNKVIITIKQSKMFNEISIANDGNKISAKDLPHIFERFYKGENKALESVGIGLSLAKEIIARNDGMIEVTTTDELTTFKIKYRRH